MTCEEFKDFLSAYADGEIASDEKVLLQAHLSVCENCAKLADELKSLKFSLSRVPQKELPDLFMPLLKQKLGFAQPPAVFPAEHFFAFARRFFALETLWTWAFPLLASCALVLLAASYVLQNKLHKPADPEQFFFKAHTQIAMQNPFIEPVSFTYSGLDDEWLPQEAE